MMSNIHLLSDFYIPQLRRHRSIYIYLPNNYPQANYRYPVIYMQDGQNLFDTTTAFAREWQVDKTLNKLLSSRHKGVIVVGIANGGQYRQDEYAPFVRANVGGGQADQYLQFLCYTLKPYIDHNFVTNPHRTATALVGSSMGGLLSFYAGLRYSEIFGKIGVFSPSLWYNPQVYALAQPSTAPTQWYVVGSRTESLSMTSTLQNIYWTLKNAGYPDTALRVSIRDRGKHNEFFWGNEFKKMYKWWFMH